MLNVISSSKLININPLTLAVDLPAVRIVLLNWDKVVNELNTITKNIPNIADSVNYCVITVLHTFLQFYTNIIIHV